MGRQGEYLTDPQWNRLGMARDRIFKLEWDGLVTALNGAYVQSCSIKVLICFPSKHRSKFCRSSSTN